MRIKSCSIDHVTTPQAAAAAANSVLVVVNGKPATGQLLIRLESASKVKFDEMDKSLQTIDSR